RRLALRVGSLGSLADGIEQRAGIERRALLVLHIARLLVLDDDEPVRAALRNDRSELATRGRVAEHLHQLLGVGGIDEVVVGAAVEGGEIAAQIDGRRPGQRLEVGEIRRRGGAAQHHHNRDRERRDPTPHGAPSFAAAWAVTSPASGAARCARAISHSGELRTRNSSPLPSRLGQKPETYPPETKPTGNKPTD